MRPAIQPVPMSFLGTAPACVSNWRLLAAPDWFGIIRTVMMVLGGLVVVAIVLTVAVAVIAGVSGMIGKIKGKGS